MRVVFSPEAIADLVAIDEFLRTQSEDRALLVLDRIERACDRLADAPRAGRERPEIRPGLRSVFVSGFVVFYRVGTAQIEVARVMHSARDVDVLEFE